jgi:hypothetical protein
VIVRGLQGWGERPRPRREDRRRAASGGVHRRGKPAHLGDVRTELEIRAGAYGCRGRPGPRCQHGDYANAQRHRRLSPIDSHMPLDHGRPAAPEDSYRRFFHHVIGERASPVLLPISGDSGRSSRGRVRAQVSSTSSQRPSRQTEQGDAVTSSGDAGSTDGTARAARPQMAALALGAYCPLRSPSVLWDVGASIPAEGTLKTTPARTAPPRITSA